MYYIINRETEKLELHFSKEEYQARPEADKAKIKSNFLFSKRGGDVFAREHLFARSVGDQTTFEQQNPLKAFRCHV